MTKDDPENYIIPNELYMYSTLPIEYPIVFYCWNDIKLKNVEYNLILNPVTPYISFEIHKTDIYNYSLIIIKNSNIPPNLLPLSCIATINFNLTFSNNNEDLIKKTNTIKYSLIINKQVLRWRIKEVAYGVIYRNGSTQFLPNDEILLEFLPLNFIPPNYYYTGYLQLELVTYNGAVVKILDSWTTRNGSPIKYFNANKTYPYAES